MLKNNFSTILGSKLLTISNVHDNTGISRSTLSNIYNRNSTNIGLNTLIKICNYLQVPLNELIEYVPTKKEV